MPSRPPVSEVSSLRLSPFSNYLNLPFRSRSSGFGFSGWKSILTLLKIKIPFLNLIFLGFSIFHALIILQHLCKLFPCCYKVHLYVHIHVTRKNDTKTSNRVFGTLLSWLGLVLSTFKMNNSYSGTIRNRNHWSRFR